MSPWTALLESLHSALIDELNERLPDHKPELGMPIRQKELALPVAELSELLICEVSFVRAEAAAAAAVGGSGESRGFAMLSCDGPCCAKLGLETAGAWEAVVRRAGGEFMRRGISPRFGQPQTLKGAAGVPLELPRGFVTPGRIVWIPFRLHPGTCYLGVGA